MKTTRWELFLKETDFLEFKNLLWDTDEIYLEKPCFCLGARYWVAISPSDEFKVLATLRFDLQFVENPYGTEYIFSFNC